MNRLAFLYLILYIGGCGALAGDFLVRVNLTGAQIADIHFGCAEKATDGYDAKMDIFAPPMGMGTGIVGMVNPEPNLPSYYKDVRSLKLPQTWSLRCEPLKGGKPIVLKWDTAQLPADVKLTLVAGKEKHDMRTKSEFAVKRKTIVSFVAEKPAPVGTAEP